MRRLAGIAVAAMLLAAGGQATVWAQGGKQPKLAAVPLSVEVVTDQTMRITSDGSGPYIDGVDGTRANIDQYGNLIIAFGRPVVFDYSEPADGTGDPRAVSGSYSSYISTLANGVAMQNVSPGTPHCIRLNWQYDIPNGFFRFGFHRGFTLDDPDDTSYAVVTRVDLNTWEVEPRAGTCGTFTNPDSVASVFTQVTQRGKWIVEEYGQYRMPFRLVLNRKQP
jgi:hypothetical protein